MISIIIVNHNTGSILNECINSVLMYENTKELEIIIIDNYSKDSSREIISSLTEKHNFISAILTDTLLSFSAANNAGIKQSSGEYVLIMNPDIIFTGPILKKLISETNKNKEIGAISPALNGTDGKFQRNYFQRYRSIIQFIYFYSVLAPLFNKSAPRMNRYLENQDIDTTQKKIYFTQQIPCAFFLTTRQVLDDIGLMDENYILFFEDVDLSYCIHKKNLLAVDTSVSVTHLGGSSFKSDDNWWMYGRFIASMIYFFRKNYSAGKAAGLKMLIKVNSNFVLLLEKIKSIFGKKDEYRYKKHEYLLKLMKEKN